MLRRHAPCSLVTRRCDVDERIKADMKQAEEKVKEEFGKVDPPKEASELEEEVEDAGSSNPPLHR